MNRFGAICNEKGRYKYLFSYPFKLAVKLPTMLASFGDNYSTVAERNHAVVR